MTSAAFIAFALGAGCRSSERQAVDASAEVAVSPTQKQLWQDAADKGAPGLERVPVPQEPVQSRARTPAQSRPVPAQPVRIPGDVRSQIRIVTFPRDPSYTGGVATVVATDNDLIELNLGPAGTLRVLARANNKPIPVMKGDMVNVAYRTRQDPELPDDVIAIRTMRTRGGAGIAHVVHSSDKLVVDLVVPLFDVKLTQNDQPGLPVLITAPGFDSLKPRAMGTTTSVDGDVRVFIVGTTPFTVNALVWSNP